jgi:hypothetical protein
LKPAPGPIAPSRRRHPPHEKVAGEIPADRAPAVAGPRHRAKAADPTRPVYLGLGQGVAFDAWEGRGSNAPPESQYVPAADIIAFDIYPYNNCGGDANVKMTCGQFWLNAFGVDRLRRTSCTRGSRRFERMGSSRTRQWSLR